jgi:hypothetical protein
MQTWHSVFLGAGELSLISTLDPSLRKGPSHMTYPYTLEDLDAYQQQLKRLDERQKRDLEGDSDQVEERTPSTTGS